MELKLINFAKRNGYDTTRIENWTKTLGYDPTRAARKKDREELAKIVRIESKTGDLKRTHALVSLLRADYALRQAYKELPEIKAKERADMDISMQVEAAFLRLLHIDLAQCDCAHVWQNETD